LYYFRSSVILGHYYGTRRGSWVRNTIDRNVEKRNGMKSTQKESKRFELWNEQSITSNRTFKKITVRNLTPFTFCKSFWLT
jgi:hypothetical protein